MAVTLVPGFTEAWRYAGWTTTQESAAGGAVDFAGDLILCGKSNGLAFALTRDSSSTSTVSADFAAVKLDGDSGQPVWIWEDSSQGGADWMVSAGTDSANDVFLGGFTNGGWVADRPNVDGNRDIAAVKLSGPTGRELWRYQAGSSNSSSPGENAGISYVLGLAVDSDDNPIMVGSAFNPSNTSTSSSAQDVGDWDFFAIKLDGSSGENLWRVQGGTPFTREGLRGIKIDTSGDVLAAGYVADEDSGGDINFLVVKLSGLDGSIMWTYPVTSTTSGDVFHDVDVDERGNVMVAGGEGVPTIEGKFAMTPVVMKLDGDTGQELWAYRGADGDRVIFHSVAVDQNTGWVVGAGATRGDWVEGSSQGGFDFAVVVLDEFTGDELMRWQNGTVGNDVIKFAQFDFSGALYVGGFSSAAWTGGAGDEDVIAIKFEPLLRSFAITESPTASPTSAPTSSPTGAPTILPSPFSTPTPTTPTPTRTPTMLTPMPTFTTPAPAGATRDIPLPSPPPTMSATPSSTSVLEVAEGGGDTTSESVLAQWAIGAIAAAGGIFLVLLGLCLCSVRRRAKAKMAEIAAANEKAQRVLPIPSTKEQEFAFAALYGDDDEESKFSAENTSREAVR
eukprot:g13748.t1